MCIVVISTAHPDYALILLNNRDEYLSRPTAPAAFWDAPHAHVLAGRDQQHAARGTWLGVTRDGRIAALTNFHEPDAAAAAGQVSRGEMVKAFLTQPGSLPPRAFAEGLLRGGPGSGANDEDGTGKHGEGADGGPDAYSVAAAARGAGGFSLVCGRAGGELAVVSNRMGSASELGRIAADACTVALSNAAFGDRSWPKVPRAEGLLREFVKQQEAAAPGERLAGDALVGALLALLDTDDMPGAGSDRSRMEGMANVRRTVFVPLVGEPSAAGEPDPAAPLAYGTRQQTVVLVDRDRNLTYVERTLRDGSVGGGPKTRRFDFRIDS